MNIIFYLLLAIILEISNSTDLSHLSHILHKFLASDSVERTTAKWLFEPATAKVLSSVKWARSAKRRSKKESRKSISADYSSEMHEDDINKQWKEGTWAKKQNELLNLTRPDGNVVNMAAARPWGRVCGDPSIHDMPWGSCMLPMECEPDLRIYKGDYFCGVSSTFVCCGIVNNVYDLYKEFDASFASLEDSSLKDKDSIEEKKKQKSEDRKHRQEERNKRKRKIKRTIRKIISEVRSILNKLYKNGTKSKQKKTKQMKQFIQALKNQYKNDRQAIKDVHEIEMITIDARLKKRLEEIKLHHLDFMNNATFRQIIERGKISIHGARMLLESYPELEPYFTRPMKPNRKMNNYLDYDIEYGLLYH